MKGYLDPINYSDPNISFTTSEISISLNPYQPSFLTIDSTGEINSHTVMNIAFSVEGNTYNNGDITHFLDNINGIFTVDESGTLGPLPVDMNINHAELTDAGIFTGTIAEGKNPIWFPIPEPPPFPPIDRNICEGRSGSGVAWRFSAPITLELPSQFINGSNIPISGGIDACAIPEPPSLMLILGGLIGLALMLPRHQLA